MDKQALAKKFFKRPRSAAVNITGKCNLKCIYCAATGINDVSELTYKQWQTICEKLRKAGATQAIAITGGEPFLHPYIEQICNDALLMFPKIGILTNGMLLGPAKDWLVQLKPKKRMEFVISLDGGSCSDNAKTRVGSNFSEILSNAQFLVDIGFTVKSACTVTKHLTKESINMMLGHLFS